MGGYLYDTKLDLCRGIRVLSSLISCGTTRKDKVSLDILEVGSNEGIDARVVLTGQSHSCAQTGWAHNLDPIIPNSHD